MQNLIVLLNKNTVKITTVGKEGLGYQSSRVSEEAVYEYKIKDPDKFSQELSEAISSVTNTSTKNLSLTFLLGPKDVILSFVTVAKGDGDIEERIIAEVSKKLENVSLDDLYFSYEKIAPFVYQFVGVRKETIENYMTTANNLGISLRAVIPWVLLLPKYTKMCDPAIYIINYDGDQVVALSELNGVFFTELFENEQDPKEFEEVIQKLTVYKRPNPINRLYTINYPSLMLDEKRYEVKELEIPNIEVLEEKGYELNLLANYMVDTTKDTLSHQINLLNLLPVPVEANKKSTALVYVGAVACVLLLIGGVVFAGSRLNKNSSGSNIPSSNQVLSENNTNESTQSEKPQESPQPKEELKRGDMSIRIENGAGIPGIAGRTQERLEELGYKISDIGNADQIGNAETVLRFKKDNVKYADLLKEDMKDVYLTIEVEDSLDVDAEYDVLVIVGTDVSE